MVISVLVDWVSGPAQTSPLLDSHRAAASAEGETGEEATGFNFSQAVRWVSGPCCICQDCLQLLETGTSLVSSIRTRAGIVSERNGGGEREGEKERDSHVHM